MQINLLIFLVNYDCCSLVHNRLVSFLLSININLLFINKTKSKLNKKKKSRQRVIVKN